MTMMIMKTTIIIITIVTKPNRDKRKQTNKQQTIPESFLNERTGSDTHTIIRIIIIKTKTAMLSSLLFTRHEPNPMAKSAAFV